MLYLGGLTRLLSLIKTKQTCNELILIFTTFVPFFSIWILQGMLGREASLWAEGCYSVLGFFFHNQLLSSFLNQRPESGRALQRFIYAPLSCLFSLPLSLCSVLSAYNDAAQQKKNILCNRDAYFMQDDLDEAAERKACQFKRSWLGQCSGMQDPHYGYSQGRPCILLRMNRVS